MLKKIVFVLGFVFIGFVGCMQGINLIDIDCVFIGVGVGVIIVYVGGYNVVCGVVIGGVVGVLCNDVCFCE